MKLQKYNDFIKESKLQLIFEELKLTMSNDFYSILQTMNNPIAGRLLSDRNDDIDNIRITDFDIDPGKNDKVLFDGGKQSIYIGRLASAYLRSIQNDSNDSYVDHLHDNIEKFVNQYKAAWDSLHTVVNFEVISGIDIKWSFDGDNYQSLNNGTLAGSCMRKPNCQAFFDLYTENSSCKMLIQKEGDNQLKGRAILWEAKIAKSSDTLNNAKDILFMDRIYTNNDSDVILFINWANENGYHYKMEQNNISDGQIGFNGNVVYDSDEYIIFVKLDKGFSTNKWPYLDTLKYYYSNGNNDFITNVNYLNDSILGKYKFTLEEYDGTNSNTCKECEDTGYVECEDCDWNGDMKCLNCDGKGEVDGDECEYCNGDGDVPCMFCNGEKQVPCKRCNKYG